MRSLSAVFASLLGLGLFMGAIWAGCGAFLKNNAAYERGLRAALSDRQVREVLGDPVYESWFYNGSIEGDGMTSRGAWSVRVKGSRTAGTLHIAGYKTAGEWRVLQMRLTVDGEHYTFQPGAGFVPATSGDPTLGPPDILGDAP